MKLIDLTNGVFGRWTVIELAERRNRGIYWRVKCVCGNEKLVLGASLKDGSSKSCGCLQIELTVQRSLTHGMKGSPEYESWGAMKARCLRESSVGYKDYGGRGIKVCKRWLNSFENFYQDMGARPHGTSLDRINVNKSYSKNNCRWATLTEQARNKRSNKYFEWEGEQVCLVALCEKYQIRTDTFMRRLKRGWSLSKALITPVDLRFSRSTCE